MPTKQPTINFQHIRNLCEKWSWSEPKTGLRVVGFNVPIEARPTARQVSFFVRYVTGTGHYEQGEVITLKVNTRTHQRLVKFVKSGECRWLRDYLIIEIDGIRVVT